MDDQKIENGYFKIRPAARLIYTIGSDLIGDSYAALVELVKNSYDADAKKVEILFHYKTIQSKPALIITVKDDGHGMDPNTVVNKWLIPATNDKLNRETSPKGRPFQGRKGIGRFAASILGQELTILTTSSSKSLTTAVIDWRMFNTEEYLENIELLVENKPTENEQGTTIEIIAFDEKIIEFRNLKEIETLDYKRSYWTRNNIENLQNELRKLISPFQKYSNDPFEISLSFRECPFEEFNQDYIIAPYPIIELFDYRIHGTIENGIGKLTFENHVDQIKQTEEIQVNYKLEKGGIHCGKIDIDFRVFDRDSEAIGNLINKGLINPITEKYIGKNEAKRLLNEVYGVNIYRNDFRIRPYGNGGVDWLDLDRDRIQNFTLKISNNQIVGFVTVESEEKSGLLEKSARDGLKENGAFLGLKELCQKSLQELETRRLIYRQKTQKSRKQKSVSKSIDELFSLEELREVIVDKLKSLNITNDTISEINTLISKESTNKGVLLEEIQKTIAVYQGQATLGKIVSFILHEGRKSIHFFRNEGSVIKRYLKFYRASKDEELLEDISKSIDGFEKHSNSISDLFARINPLASQSRGDKRIFNVYNSIQDAYQIFRRSLESSNISFKFICDENLEIFGWSNDIYISIANLIENSIYWLDVSGIIDKEITITVTKNIDGIIIIYQDNGPGLNKDEIQTGIIFEPGYSKKLNGTGLGLAIAGEAIERLNGTLVAHESDLGAYFQIEITTS